MHFYLTCHIRAIANVQNLNFNIFTVVTWYCNCYKNNNCVRH